MRFENAQLLWLLLVIPPALMLLFWWAGRRRQKILTQFISARLLPALTVGISPARRKIRAGCVVLSAALLIVTLARPQWGYSLEEVTQRGLDIVIAIDTSKSMLATDIAPNRLARAKLAAFDLLKLARTDRLGLVAFAGDAFLQCPLTIDEAVFRQGVDSLNVNSISRGGTAIGAAIRTAQTAFKTDDNFKVLVLFTDGEDNDEGALDAAKDAAKEGMKIFTVGIGTKEGELLNPNLVRDEQGNAVKSHLNEDLLTKIASATDGGFYLPLSGAKTMDTLYERGLAPLPKSEHAEKTVKHYREQFYWPLAAAILMLLVEILLPERKRVRRETSNIQHPTSNIQSAAVLLALLVSLPVAASASPQSAEKDYRAGKFAVAQQEYERLAATNKTFDARLVFNAGDAAYRMTNYDAALKLFTESLLAPDIKLQQAAYFNLGNTQFRLGQTAKDLDAMQRSWELAITNYQNAVKLNTNDMDAVFNLSFAKRGVDQINALREALRRAKSVADAAVRQAEFHRALEIMESLTQQNPFAKQFEDYVKKLKDIDAIATPAQP